MKKTDRRSRSRLKTQEQQPIFEFVNYKYMALGFLLIVVGFSLMALENQINGFLSLYVSPWLLFAGFLTFGYGILAPKQDQEQKTPTEN